MGRPPKSTLFPYTPLFRSRWRSTHRIPATTKCKGAGARGQPDSGSVPIVQFRSERALVLRGDLVDAVDDEEVDGDFFGLELEAELLLEGGEEVGEAGVGVVGGGVRECEVVEI